MNKKGLSEVITTVLIILLVLAAIVVIWSAVKPALDKGANEISGASECFNFDVSVQSCKIINSATGNVSITLTKGTKDIEVVSLKYLFIDADGNQQSLEDATTTLSALDVKTISLVNAKAVNATKIAITGKVKTSAGAEKTCDQIGTAVTCA